MIAQQERSGLRWLTWIRVSDPNTIMLITSHQITEGEAAAIQAKYLEEHEYDDVPQADISIYDWKETLRDAVLWIRANDPTLNQWNGYLKTLTWDDAYMIRWFLASVAKKLAERGEVDLSDYTETQVLAKLKTLIVTYPLRKLAKILFGE